VPRLVAVEGEVSDDGRYSTFFNSASGIVSSSSWFSLVSLYIVTRRMNRHPCLHSRLPFRSSVNTYKMYVLEIWILLLSSSLTWS